MTDSDPFFVVAVDERLDIWLRTFNAQKQLSASDREMASSLKRIVFEGITSAVEHGLAKSSIAVWADTDLGESTILRAKAMSMTTVCSPGYIAHSLSRLSADFTGVQLTLNPEGPIETHSELLSRLKVVSDKARDKSMPLLVELNTVPTQTQIKMYNGFVQARATLLLKAVKQLQDHGVEPAIWAFVPPDDETFTATLAAQAHVDDRMVKVLLVAPEKFSGWTDESGLSTDRRVAYERRTIRLASLITGVDGILVGPGSYFDQLVSFNDGLMTRRETIDAIAKHLGSVDEVFKNSRTASKVV